MFDAYTIYLTIACVGGLIAGGIAALAFFRAAAKVDEKLGLK